MIKNTFSKILPRINIIFINQISSLITIPWIAFYFSKLTFGYIGISLIIIQLGWLFINWINLNYIFEKWNLLKGKKNKSKIVSDVISSQLFLLCFYLGIIFILICIDFIIIPFDYFFALLPSLIFGGLFPLWFFHVMNDSNKLVNITFISRAIFLIFTFVFINNDSKAILFLLFQGFSFFIITF